MLRSTRIAQLLVVLCLCALISAYVSLVTHRVLESVALPRFATNLSRDLGGLQDMAVVKKVCTAVVDGAFEVHANGNLLASWGIGFVLMWATLIGLVGILLLRQLARDGLPGAEPARENIVDLALSGRLELWKAFWGFFVGLSLVVALAAFGLSMLFSSPGASGTSMRAALLIYPLAISIATTVYLVSGFAVWRCAANTSRAAWRYLARGTVLVLTTGSVIKSLAAASFLFGR